MSFRFSLGSVLRFRESMEQREYLELEKLYRETATLEEGLRQTVHLISAATVNRERRLMEGLQAADLISACEYERSLQMQCEVLRSRLRQAKMNWQKQLDVYQTARRKRETLEKLRSSHLDAYNREQAKREQSTLDDLFLSRRQPHK